MASISQRITGRPSPNVLELRIHGISNTPAAAMLDLPLEQIEQVDGDELAGFWAPTPAAAAAGSRLPPEDRHYIPRMVQREAYSWGLLARTAPGVPGRVLGVAVAGAIRLGWALLIPFGLANVAYWSRPVPSPGENRRGWRDANGAAELRVFALALTLLFVASASAVSLDLIAVQCYPGPQGKVVAQCTQLPAILSGLTGWTRGQRLALASVVPVALLIGLFWLSRSGRVRFDERISKTAATRGVRAATDGGASWQEGPLLATTGFWYRRLLAIATARLHLAAGLCLVALCLAWDQIFAHRRGCDAPHTFFGAVCRQALGAHWNGNDVVVAGLGVVAVVVLLLVVYRVCVGAESSADVSRIPGGSERKIWSGWLLLTASVVLVGITGLLSIPWTDGSGRVTSESMLGLVAVPTVLVAVLLALAIAGLGWRRGVRARTWLTLFVLGGGFALLARLWPGHDGAAGWVRGVAVAGAVVTLVLQLVAVRVGGRGQPAARSAVGGAHRDEAWAGLGPGVFMLLAAGGAMILSGLLVTGTADWLNAPVGADVVVVPAAYREFGAATLAALVVLLLVVGWLAWARRRLTFIAPAPRSTPAPVDGTDDPRSRLDPSPTVDPEVQAEDALRVLQGRRVAAYTQLAEPVLGWLAALMGLALLTTLALSGRIGVWEWFETAGTWALGAGALAIVAAAVAGAANHNGRPLGLIWDLMCFLPRTAHPFGPPAYAERVVPELRGRVDRWLDASPDRRVVLSAHSLGAVLAVACLLAREEKNPVRPRIGLVTYGTQLRPYFGRFFPELLGPETLGTAACSGPRTTSPDPWLHEVLDPPDPAVPGVATTADTVVSRLGGRGGPGGRPPAWINLWRRTDLLGFPVASYGENPVDRGAEEVDRAGYLFTVATHGGYPRSLAYHDAVAEVLRRM